MNKAYDAFPNRAFVVRKDGRLGVAAARGPRGYRPALREAEAWLAEYKEAGKEPRLPNNEIRENMCLSTGPCRKEVPLKQQPVSRRQG